MMTGRERIDAAEAELRKHIDARVQATRDGWSLDSKKIVDGQITLAIEALINAAMSVAAGAVTKMDGCGHA